MLYIVCICSCKRIDALRDVAGKSDVRSAKRLYESQLLRCQILKLVNQRCEEVVSIKRSHSMIVQQPQRNPNLIVVGNHLLVDSFFLDASGDFTDMPIDAFKLFHYVRIGQAR